MDFTWQRVSVWVSKWEPIVSMWACEQVSEHVSKQASECHGESITSHVSISLVPQSVLVRSLFSVMSLLRLKSSRLYLAVLPALVYIINHPILGFNLHRPGCAAYGSWQHHHHHSECMRQLIEEAKSGPDHTASSYSPGAFLCHCIANNLGFAVGVLICWIEGCTGSDKVFSFIWRYLQIPIFRMNGGRVVGLVPPL